MNLHPLTPRDPRPDIDLVKKYLKGSPDDGKEKAVERAIHDELYTKLNDLRYNEDKTSTDQRLDQLLDIIMESVPYNE